MKSEIAYVSAARSKVYRSADLKVQAERYSGLVRVVLPCGDHRTFAPTEALLLAKRLIAAADYALEKDETIKEF